MTTRTDVTLSQWIASAAERLEAAGVAAARSDAERLAARGLGKSWSELWDAMLAPIEPQRLETLLARRESGEPLQYIEGSVVFYGHTLACGPGVLVPRPETETLVDVSLELIAGVQGPVVVEVGTGAGGVAISIARARPDARVFATEISTAAASYAERNIEAVGADVELLVGDLFAPLRETLRGTCDLIVSNPPYIPIGTPLDVSVSREPPEALFGGSDGNEVLLRLIRESPSVLREGGALALEVGTRWQAEAMLRAFTGWSSTHVRDDHNGCPRVVWARDRHH